MSAQKYDMSRVFKGAFAVLFSRDWEGYFDLTKPALPRSFIAVLLYIPLSFVVVRAAVHYNDNTAHIPYGAIMVILGLIVLAFPLIAYLLCMVFGKTEEFRPWVIVRNWTVLFVFVCAAFGFGLYLIGVLPFFVAYVIGLGMYLATLAIDIRLAWRVARFDIISAVFTGVLISSATMMILMMALRYGATQIAPIA